MKWNRVILIILCLWAIKALAVEQIDNFEPETVPIVNDVHDQLEDENLWREDNSSTEAELKKPAILDMQTKKIINVVDPTVNQGAATKAYVDNAGKNVFTEESDPAAFDWTEGDLTLDNTWNDLDASAKATVPSSPLAVLLFVIVKDNAPGNRIEFRNKDNSNEIAVPEVAAQVNGISNSQQCIVPCDSNGDFQYRANAGTDSIDICIMGYFE